MLRKTFIEFLGLTWKKFMIRGGRENRSSQVHKSAPKRVLVEKGYFPLVFFSSCALHMGDLPQQQQNYAEHCNIIINVIFPSK